MSCEADASHSQVLIKVTDTDIGIAPQYQQMIFKPFLRVDDYHPAKGEGSTFWFTLPI